MTESTNAIELNDYEDALKERLANIQGTLEKLIDGINEKFNLQYRELDAQEKKAIEEVRNKITQEQRDIENQLIGFEMASNKYKADTEEIEQENTEYKSEVEALRKSFKELYEQMRDEVPNSERSRFDVYARGIGLIDSDEEDEPDKLSNDESQAA